MDQLRESIDVHLETTRAKLEETKTFALNLRTKLEPTYPKFYLDLMEENENLATKLLPSYLREKKKELCEKLVDIETNLEENLITSPSSGQQQNQQLDIRLKELNLNPSQPIQSIEGSTGNSLSPVEQLECDINLLQPMLPEPIKPDQPGTE